MAAGRVRPRPAGWPACRGSRACHGTAGASEPAGAPPAAPVPAGVPPVRTVGRERPPGDRLGGASWAPPGGSRCPEAGRRATAVGRRRVRPGPGVTPRRGESCGASPSFGRAETSSAGRVRPSVARAWCFGQVSWPRVYSHVLRCAIALFASVHHGEQMGRTRATSADQVNAPVRIGRVRPGAWGPTRGDRSARRSGGRAETANRRRDHTPDGGPGGGAGGGTGSRRRDGPAPDGLPAVHRRAHGPAGTAKRHVSGGTGTAEGAGRPDTGPAPSPAVQRHPVPPRHGPGPPRHGPGAPRHNANRPEPPSRRAGRVSGSVRARTRRRRRARCRGSRRRAASSCRSRPSRRARARRSRSRA